MKKPLVWLAAPVLAVALSGCSQIQDTLSSGDSASESSEKSESTENSNESTEAESAADDAESEDSESEESESEEPRGLGDEVPGEFDGELAYGDAAVWEDGMEVTISEPEGYEPSEYVDLSGDGEPVAMEVTIKNGTDEPFQAHSLRTAASSGGQEAETIYDIENDIDLPSTDVRPGKEITYKIAYEVKDKGDVDLDLNPGFEYDTAYYSSK
ncbi:cobalamin biosynthesis protein CobT [Micrococcus cohnii]|uniref:Cobalamin biosynthesis protein CobT n=1 Tax=Micrococcus cohnii TaxID=993416 RepID=A0A7W7M3S2_9MICC|nr:DUF4352 domain-containing protein [Micrococcus cohnii]MBB4735960.1 cobalamin biosynthesis protein CobT [Micrococcus cohnii]